MDLKSLGWPWRAAAVGALAGGALQLLVPVAQRGTAAGLLLADIPIRWFYPGREAASVVTFALLLARVPPQTFITLNIVSAIAINAALYIGAWGFVRATRRGSVWRRATLIAVAGIWFGGTLISEVAFVLLRHAMTQGGK